MVNSDYTIADFRKKKGISQSELASIVKIDRTYLSKIENGHVVPSLRMLERIAKALDVSIKDLL